MVADPQAKSPINRSVANVELSGNAGSTLFFVFTAVLELAIFVFGKNAGWSLDSFILSHVFIAVMTAFWIMILWSSGRDLGIAIIGLLTTIVAGPVGAMATSLTALTVSIGGHNERVLRDWYARLAVPGGNAEAVELFRDIVSGRAMAPEADASVNLVEIMKSGSIKEKQEIIGRISTHYHPEYLHVLKMGLNSSEPPIRIQAATVLTKQRNAEKSRFQDILTDIESLPRAASNLEKGRLRNEIASRIGASIRSGLLPDEERQLAHEKLGEILKLIEGAGDAVVSHGRAGNVSMASGRDRDRPIFDEAVDRT